MKLLEKVIRLHFRISTATTIASFTLVVKIGGMMEFLLQINHEMAAEERKEGMFCGNNLRPFFGELKPEPELGSSSRLHPAMYLRLSMYTQDLGIFLNISC